MWALSLWIRVCRWGAELRSRSGAAGPPEFAVVADCPPGISAPPIRWLGHTKQLTAPRAAQRPRPGLPRALRGRCSSSQAAKADSWVWTQYADPSSAGGTWPLEAGGWRDQAVTDPAPAHQITHLRCDVDQYLSAAGLESDDVAHGSSGQTVAPSTKPLAEV